MNNSRLRRIVGKTTTRQKTCGRRKRRRRKNAAHHLICVCVYIYICVFNLKFTASKGRLNAEQKRECRIRIKESQRGVFVCLVSFLPCVKSCFLGRNLKKIKKKRKRSDQFVRPKNKGDKRTLKGKLFKNRT